MKGDFTRSTFRPHKRYSAVRMQQGRVQLDADWNEELDILQHLDGATRIDVIGHAGAPKDDTGGFQIGVLPGGSDLTISAGRMYVGGMLTELAGTPQPIVSVTAAQLTLGSLSADREPLKAPQWLELAADGVVPITVQITAVDPNEPILTFAPTLSAAQVAALSSASGRRATRIATYLTQSDLPDAPSASTTTPPTLALTDGSYLAYLDVWARHVTTLEDPDLREVALGGPDTATRSQTVRQVRLVSVTADEATAGCGGAVAAFDTRAAPGSGRLSARAEPQKGSGSDCLIPADAGFRRLENQLYRVEIHAAGPLGTA